MSNPLPPPGMGPPRPRSAHDLAQAFKRVPLVPDEALPAVPTLLEAVLEDFRGPSNPAKGDVADAVLGDGNNFRA